MTLKAIVFDTGGVLYHRPREDRHLAEFLDRHGLKLRHRAVLNRALRAARFDAHTGRISLEDLYDAILRIHNLPEDDEWFAEGREALYRDAADIELFPGVVETLNALQEAGYRLAAVSDTAHAAGEKIAWLAARGLSPGLWTAFIVSSDVGSTLAEGAIFARALRHLDAAAEETAFVGHASDELECASEMSMVTIAFLPDDPGAQAHYTIGSFYGLAELFLEA